MKRTIEVMLLLLSASTAMFFTNPSEALLNIGPNGAYPQPYSPDCTPPQVWTMTNGHYSCANSPSPPALPPAEPPSNPSPAAICSAALPAGYELGWDWSVVNNPVPTSWTLQTSAGYTIELAQGMGYRVSSMSDTAYEAAALGPYVQIGGACELQDTYIAYCLVTPGGNADSVFTAAYGVSDGACNH
jgi:hypothetical protein